MSENATLTPLTESRASGQTRPVAKKRRTRLKPVPAKSRVLRREEFDRLVDLFNMRGELINELRHDLDIQFKRMAQMQSELDDMQRTLQRLAGSSKS
jgi:hypothetical protein